MDEDAPVKQSEDELVLAVACGEQAAIAELVRRYAPSVCGMLKKKFPEIWEDAWHDALVRIVDKINYFDSNKGSLKAWFTKLAQNCAIDIIRVEREHSGTEAHEDIAGDKRRPTPEPKTPKQRKAAEWRRDQIREAVDALPEKERRIILADLADPDGKAPTGPLVDAWGTTENAIHQARNRAKKKLREELTRRGVYREDRGS